MSLEILDAKMYGRIHSMSRYGRCKPRAKANPARIPNDLHTTRQDVTDGKTRGDGSDLDRSLSDPGRRSRAAMAPRRVEGPAGIAGNWEQVKASLREMAKQEGSAPDAHRDS